MTTRIRAAAEFHVLDLHLTDGDEAELPDDLAKACEAQGKAEILEVLTPSADPEQPLEATGGTEGTGASPAASEPPAAPQPATGDAGDGTPAGDAGDGTADGAKGGNAPLPDAGTPGQPEP